MNDRPVRPGEKFLGWILMTSGVLIMALSGLCSAGILMSSLGREFGGMLVLVLIFGGVPFLVGWLLFAGGRALAIREPSPYLRRYSVSDPADVFGDPPSEPPKDGP